MFWRLFTRSSDIERFRHGESPWALVTGASDGIGKALVQTLASRVADATQPALVSKVAEAVVGKRLTIAINNVGDVEGPVQIVENATPEDIERSINLGASWLTQLTRVLLPYLIANQPSLMINIGSLVAKHPSPYLAIYSATKAYTLAFTHALAVEHRKPHPSLRIQYCEVHGVATPSSNNPESFIIPSPQTIAKAVISSVGRRSDYVVPYWPHEFMSWVLAGLPGGWIDAMLETMFREKRTDIRGDK
ncbi:hypothetical protein JAAARDRAFT_200359 [Jaapia argillacea MUCL 33604]|uniref:NAD(P)-binding protein n=1 Tax=Jaapia argillacea MUCL 33604 TaxID=933084 RepID=A0A067P895_9AGAM|nr:hypothetical protein JAAARDRAFT_200359 [Jaapia argillacea MUCL 33604]